MTTLSVDQLVTADDETLASLLRGAVVGLEPRVTISTADLVDRIMPRGENDSRVQVARARLFAVVTSVTRHGKWADCWTRGAERKGKFGVVRPYLWHAPHAPCPHCHGSGFLPQTVVKAPDDDPDYRQCLTCARAPHVRYLVNGICPQCREDAKESV